MDGANKEAMLKRLKVRRDFRMHLGAYLIVNAMLVAIWAMAGANSFWPGWLILFWGVGLAFHGWWAFFGQPILESDLPAENDRS